MRKAWLILISAVGIAFIAGLLGRAAMERAGFERDVVTVKQNAPSAEPVRLMGAASALTLREAVRRAIPTVVNVYTSKRIASRSPYADDPLFRRYFGDDVEGSPERATSLGSGVIVSAQGYILTNNHVIEGADEVAVSLRGGKRRRSKSWVRTRKRIWLC